MITFTVESKFRKFLGIFKGKKIFYEKNDVDGSRQEIRERNISPDIELDQGEFIKIYPGPNWSIKPNYYFVNYPAGFTYGKDFIFHGTPNLIENHDGTNRKLRISRITPPPWHLEIKHPNSEIQPITDYGNVEVGEDKRIKPKIKRIIKELFNKLKNFFSESEESE